MAILTLVQWRAAQVPPRTLTSVARDLDVSHPLISEWEKGTRKPGVELALRLEKLTGGAVPIESWGYTRDLVDLMRTAVERRDGVEVLHDAAAVVPGAAA
jgi:transcriptional regulator with XRE-family HTH domain